MAVQTEGVTKVYQSRDGGAVTALQDIDITIEPGEFVSLIGPSGCGKSTMLDLVVGLTQPTSGRVLVNGGPPAGPQAKVGMVFQKPIMLPWRTVMDNVVLPAQLGRRPEMRLHGPALRQRARELLETVGLDSFTDKYPWELSGGMQSRVAIARALLLETEVLCMDEPFAALDEFTREQMHMEILDVWHRGSFTVLFVTHNIFEAVFLSDRILVMSPRPGSVVDCIPIDLPRPRRPEMIGSTAFAEAIGRVRTTMSEFWSPERSDGDG